MPRLLRQILNLFQNWDLVAVLTFIIPSILAESVVTYAGERFDFIINANQTEDLYWMRFRGLMDCDERFKSAHQVAILQYTGTSDTDFPEGLPSYTEAHKEGLVCNLPKLYL